MLGVVPIGTLPAMFDVVIINVAIPSIRHDLHASFDPRFAAACEDMLRRNGSLLQNAAARETAEKPQ